MPDPVTKERPAGLTRIRYEDDPYSWALEQCALLEAGAFDRLDVVNLVDEVGDVARREFDSLVSAIRVLVLHLLKWDHQAERRSRSWVLTIAEQRDQIATILDDNPGLKSRRNEAVKRAYRKARFGAARETGLPLRSFPVAEPYGWEEVIGREISEDEIVSP